MSFAAPGRAPLQSRNPNTINGVGGLGGSSSSIGNAFPITTASAQAQGSFSSRGGGNSSTEEYNSKDLGALNRLSTLEASHNENNKRLTSSTSYALAQNQSGVRSNNNSLQNVHHPPMRRNSANDIRDGSDTGLPTSATAVASSTTRPRVAQRSNSLPTPNDATCSNIDAGGDGGMSADDVIIEEKRPNLNREGYTVHRYLRGKMLGKGGFAKVYLCTALDTNKAYAIKIVPKANLVKARARQKVRKSCLGTAQCGATSRPCRTSAGQERLFP